MVTVTLLETSLPVVFFAWVIPILVPRLRRWQRPLIVVAAVTGTVAFVSGELVARSSSLVAIVVGVPIAIVALVVELLLLAGLFVVCIHHLAATAVLVLRFRSAADLLQKDDPAAAEQAFRRLAAAAGGHPGIQRAAIVNTGASLSRQGQYRAARETFETALVGSGRRAGQRATVLYNLAWVAFMSRDFESAEQRLRESQAAGPGPARLQVLTALLEGRLSLRHRDFAAAAAAFDRAANAAARARSAESLAWVEVQRGILEYLRGDRETGRERILAALPAHTGADGRRLAAIWLAGLSVLAVDGDRQLFRERAAELAGRDLGDEADAEAAYLQA